MAFSDHLLFLIPFQVRGSADGLLSNGPYARLSPLFYTAAFARDCTGEEANNQCQLLIWGTGGLTATMNVNLQGALRLLDSLT